MKETITETVCYNGAHIECESVNNYDMPYYSNKYLIAAPLGTFSVWSDCEQTALEILADYIYQMDYSGFYPSGDENEDWIIIDGSHGNTIALEPETRIINITDQTCI